MSGWVTSQSSMLDSVTDIDPLGILISDGSAEIFQSILDLLEEDEGEIEEG